MSHVFFGTAPAVHFLFKERKRKMKKIIFLTLIVALFLSALFCISASAEGTTTTVGYLTFTEHDTYCEVTGCDDSATGEIEIPSSVDFLGTVLPVTHIGHSAFSGSSITDVTIPDSIEIICEYAFFRCKSLTSITIPGSVTSIGFGSFIECSSLTSVTMLEGVETIGNSVFHSCRNLITVNIPNSVITIGDHAFAFCNGLTDISIHGNIGNGAFYECRGLVSVSILDDVLSIGDSAFERCTSLESVTIPGNVISIGDFAFCECSNISSLTISDGVKTIGYGAFKSCSNLTSVTIPSSVTSIDIYAFCFCANIENMSVSYDNSVYYSSGNCIIEKNSNKLISGCKNSVIPVGTTSIEEGSFYGCDGLTSIIVPDGVISIGRLAFERCDNLTMVTLPESITVIDEAAFPYFTTLTDVFYGGRDENDWNEINIGSENHNLINAERHYKVILTTSSTVGTISVTPNGTLYESNTVTVTAADVENYVFIGWFKDGERICETRSYTFTISEDTALEARYDLLADWSYTVSSNEATITKYNGTKTVVYTPAVIQAYTVTTIGNSAFRENDVIETVILSNTVTAIGEYAFYQSNLSSIKFSNNLSTIGAAAFAEDYELTSITFPESVTSIEASAFYNSNEITEIHITDLTKWCNISFGGGNASNPLLYARYLYLNGVKIVDLVIPDGITSIGDYTFNGGSFTSVTMHEGITSIGIGAFQNCLGLTNIIIPDSVSTIGTSAFRECYNLTSVKMPETATSMGTHVFYGCYRLKSIKIPDGVKTLGDYTFYNCSGLELITIPNSVKTIGDNAFQGCSNHYFVVYYKGTETQWNRITIGVNNGNNTTIGGRVYYSVYENGLYYKKDSDHYVVCGADYGITGNITIPESITVNNVEYPVTAIDDYVIKFSSIQVGVFCNRTGITGITIPDSITTIGVSAFNGCESLADVTFEGTREQWNSVAIGENNTPLSAATIICRVTLSAESTDGICNISYTPDDPIFESNTVTLTAEDVDGWSFLGWYKGGEKVSNTLVYEFVITEDTTLLAKYVPTGSSYVTVNVVNGAQYSFNGGALTAGGTETVQTGSTVTLTAGDGDKVLQWENESHKVLGTGGSLTLTVTGNMSVTLVYKSEGENQAYVQFVSDSGQVLSAGLFLSTDTITFPPYNPSKTGFTFVKWIIDGTDTEATEDNVKACFGDKIVTVRPSYAQINESYTVTVQYTGTDRADDSYADIQIGTGYTVTAPDIDGKVFQMWKDASGTKVLSYKPEYYLLVMSNVTLTAVYGDTAETAQPTITISEIRKSGDASTHKVAASVTRSIPDGYTLVEHGVLYAKYTGTLVLELDGVGVKKYVSDKTALNGVVTQNIKVSSDDLVVAIRGYMILKDSNDVLQVYYTDIVTGSYTGLA